MDNSREIEKWRAEEAARHRAIADERERKAFKLRYGFLPGKYDPRTANKSQECARRVRQAAARSS